MACVQLDYETLIRPIEDRMMAAVWRIVQNVDDAEDAFQATVVTIWKQLDRIRRHRNPQALILRICINTAFDVLRKRNRLARREHVLERPDAQSAPGVDAAEALGEEECRQEIACAIARLSEQQSTAVTMRYILEQPYRDVAEALGCTETTARIHVSRGLNRLRSLLSHLNPSPFTGNRK